ncbi:MAG TPA: hypothetical protein VM101_13085 [Flavitalea sp.]|nr:hypothetical protein [Flavitalea sp.]
MKTITEEECVAMVKYLTGIEPDHKLIDVYQYASKKIPVALSVTDEKLWKACVKHTWLIPYIDAYLGFSQPTHPIRKKLFMVLALLETQPEYHQFFLTSGTSRLKAFFIVAAVSVSSVIKIIIGRILLWII